MITEGEIIPNREQKSPKVDLTDDNIKKCVCPNCPTYSSSSCPSENKEGIFCSIGLTACDDVEKEGCICGSCEVFSGHGLKNGYFCEEGEANENGEPIMMEKEEMNGA